MLLSDGSRARAARLILATGLRETWPDVAGLDALLTATHGFLTCPYCDGFEVRGRPLAVLGADPMSARLALQLKMRFSADVVLCTNGMQPELASMRAYGLATTRSPGSSRPTGRSPESFSRVARRSRGPACS